MTKQRLLEFLNGVGPVSAEDVALNFDLTDSGARSALHRLLRQALVKRLGDQWMLTARGLDRLDYLKGKSERRTAHVHDFLDEPLG